MSKENRGEEKRPIVFGRSFRGYNKNDVNDYIAEMDKEHAAELTETEKKLSDALLDAAHAREKSDTLENELINQKNEYNNLKAENDDLNTKFELLKKEFNTEKQSIESDLDAARSSVSELVEKLTTAESGKKSIENRLADILAQKEDLENRLSDLSAEKQEYESKINELTEKITESDKRFSEIKNIVPEFSSDSECIETSAAAKSEAEQIIRNARRDAVDIRREAALEAELAREIVRTKADTAMRDIYEMIDKASQSSIGEIMQTVEKAENATEQLSEQITVNNSNTSIKVSQIRYALESEIEKRISEIGCDTEDMPPEEECEKKYGRQENKSDIPAESVRSTGTDSNNTVFAPNPGGEKKASDESIKQQRKKDRVSRSKHIGSDSLRDFFKKVKRQ
ncbi:MAG: hypothetical protein MJ102_00460 [Clostridia bacterium]|nr:hypothetical protein [Clostridia bacterium]